MRKWMFRILYTALVMLPVGALANYAVTVGTGTNFGSVVIGGTVHFASMLVCDFTTANQCTSVSASNALKVDGSAVTQPVSVAGSVAVTNATIATKANQDTNAATTAHTCSVAGYSEIGCLGQIDDDVKGPIVAGTAHVGTVGVAPYADGAVPITATATGTTAATTATLAASAGGLKTYICGFSIRANATAAVTNNATVTGVITATMNFTQWTAPLASGLGVTEMIFTPCIPSSATNTAINVISGAPGTGGVVSVSAWGYQL